MDKELKEKWVKALRSKKYRQATNALVADGAYCCLGVLARIQGAKFRDGEPWLGGENIGGPTDRCGLLKYSICGIRGATQQRLAKMNDSGTTFPELADYIEANL